VGSRGLSGALVYDAARSGRAAALSRRIAQIAADLYFAWPDSRVDEHANRTLERTTVGRGPVALLDASEEEGVIGRRRPRAAASGCGHARVVVELEVSGEQIDRPKPSLRVYNADV
jgi:hypothetical protein